MQTLARIFTAALLFVSTSCFADSARHVDELLHKSGIWKQVADFPGQMKAGAEQARAEAKAAGKAEAMSDAEYARFVAAMARAFSADRFRRIMARELERNLSAADEAKMLQFLSSDLGVRATRAEEAMSDPAMAVRMRQEADAYYERVPGARISKLTRLLHAFKGGESAASTMINIASAIAYGAAVASPNGDEAIARDMRRSLEKQRESLTVAMNRQLVKMFAYVYQSLSDEDLDRYAEFAKTPAAEHFTDVTIKAMDIGFQEGALELGRYIGREAGKNGRTS